MLSVQRIQGLVKVPKTVKSSIIGRDKWHKIEKFRSRNFRRFSRGKQNIFAKLQGMK